MEKINTATPTQTCIQILKFPINILSIALVFLFLHLTFAFIVLLNFKACLSSSYLKSPNANLADNCGSASPNPRQG